MEISNELFRFVSLETYLSSTIKGIIILKIYLHFKTADIWISVYYSLKDNVLTYKKKRKNYLETPS